MDIGSQPFCIMPNAELMLHAKSQSGQKVFVSACYPSHQMPMVLGLIASSTGSCTCCHAVLSSVPLLLPQVMRSKLVSQTQPLPAVSLTSRGDMLLRCQGMFAASLQQVHAATRELHNLQQFMRFHATREDMAWAAASEMQPCATAMQI